MNSQFLTCKFKAFCIKKKINTIKLIYNYIQLFIYFLNPVKLLFAVLVVSLFIFFSFPI